MSTPVAGPGSLSRRTDMTQKLRDLPDAGYGEQATYQAQQKGAPMDAQPSIPPMDLSQLFGGAGANVTPLHAPTANPNQPVTDGAALGAGAGLEALGLGQPKSQADLQAMASQLPVLEWMANRSGAPWALRNLVRQIKGSL
jgi:hypothetical protein